MDLPSLGIGISVFAAAEGFHRSADDAAMEAARVVVDPIVKTKFS